MTKRTNKIAQGFTLLEMLLVLVIISAIIYMLIGYYQQQALNTRIDRTAQQMQQVLNSALAYYVENGSWPKTSGNNLDCLQGNNGCSTQYLPETFNSPFGNKYKIEVKDGVFYVYTKLSSAVVRGSPTIAQIIAGKLPLSYTSTDNGDPPDEDDKCSSSSTTCWVVASVNIPGQNLNNASAINFAGLYHHGGCVPVPQCPVDKDGNTMKPQIMVVPVSVSGINDADDPSKVYPISSFTAYATDLDKGGKPDLCKDSDDVYKDKDCEDSEQGKNKSSNGYWRVCLQVYTQEGEVAKTWDKDGKDDWGQYVTLMAVTRCAIEDEPSGSGFTVYSN